MSDFLGFDQKKEELTYILKCFVYLLSSLTMLGSEFYPCSVKARGSASAHGGGANSAANALHTPAELPPSLSNIPA